MRGRWRLFRHETARRTGPGPWVFLALHAAALAIGTLSTRAFDVVVFWPANAVMIAALLVLPRRQAQAVFLAGIGLNLINNLIRGDQLPFFLINVAMNAAEVFLASAIARRVCGGALDLSRPGRLARFGLLAVAPAVAVSTAVSVGLAVWLRGYSLDQTLFALQRFFMVETLGAMIVAPALVLLAQGAKEQGAKEQGVARQDEAARRLEAPALMVLLLGVTAVVFLQSLAPAAFLVLPFVILAAHRLTPSWVAGAVIGVALIAGAATAAGLGPLAMARLPDIPALLGPGGAVAHLAVYYVFMLSVVVTALPVSTFTTQRRRLMGRLRARTLAAQEARLRAERSDAAKSRFLALMSHEMRTPLNCVLGYAEVTAADAALPGAARERAVRIGEAGERLMAMIDDVLEASSEDDALVPAALELTEVIEAALRPRRAAAQAKGLALTVEVRPDARVALIADRRRLVLALGRLIDNAVKFTGEGRITLRADRLDGRTLIAVSDTGCGLDTGEIGRLFELFEQGDASTTRRHGGAGVGLAVARRQARLMGGDIRVSSRPGDGATFTLDLPLAPAEAAPNDAAPPAALRVLVVDDHAANREVARLMLTAMGCEVDQAEDGDEAIGRTRAGLYDLVLMDVRMPRMDGLTAARAIRALDGPAGRTPILAVTADAMPRDAARCLDAGMDGHLAKPISFQGLAQAMNQALSGAAYCADESRRASA